MRKYILLTLIVLVPFLSACCGIPDIGDLIQKTGELIQVSGNVVTEEFSITGFDQVEVSHAFTADIRQGGEFSVIIDIDESLIEYLQVVKEGSTLKIGLEPDRRYVITDAARRAEVTMPDLTGLDLSGASRATISGFKSSAALTVGVSGASGLRGDIECADARFDISGASDLTLRGSAEDVIIDASGASRVDLSGFPVADASVEASGASRVTVNASGRLDVDASGASHVTYLGRPSLGTIDTSGASSVEPE